MANELKAKKKQTDKKKAFPEKNKNKSPKENIIYKFIVKVKRVLIGILIIFIVIIFGIVGFLIEGRKVVNAIQRRFGPKYAEIVQNWDTTLRKQLNLDLHHNQKEQDHLIENHVGEEHQHEDSLLYTFGQNKNFLNNKINYDPNKEQTVRVVKQVLPGVVSIALDQTNLAYGAMLVNKQAKIGSGFVVDAKNGIIVTNRHVVEAVKGQNYKVILQDGTSLAITKVLEDPVNDLALVFVNTNHVKLHALPLGDSNHLELGQRVIAIGTPFGQFPSTVTSGIISGLHRKVTAPSDWGEKIYSNVIQTDAAINPGNSGGPLINLAGEVIGINFAKINGADNISFALPINLVKTRLEQYKKYGRFRQAFLGVSAKDLDLGTASYYGVPAGALVFRVVPNSPAYKAGIKVNDIIVSINNQAVYKVGLVNILSEFSVGDKIKIHIKRPILNKDGYGYRFKDVYLHVRLADRYDFIDSIR